MVCGHKAFVLTPHPLGLQRLEAAKRENETLMVDSPGALLGTDAGCRDCPKVCTASH